MTLEMLRDGGGCLLGCRWRLLLLLLSTSGVSVMPSLEIRSVPPSAARLPDDSPAYQLFVALRRNLYAHHSTSLQNAYYFG